MTNTMARLALTVDGVQKYVTYVRFAGARVECIAYTTRAEDAPTWAESDRERIKRGLRWRKPVLAS